MSSNLEGIIGQEAGPAHFPSLCSLDFLLDEMSIEIFGVGGVDDE